MVRPLPEDSLIAVWERCCLLHPIDQALTLLAAACPELSFQELTRLTIGERDALLLQLRNGIIGPRLDGRSCCPACKEQVEFHIESFTILANRQDEEIPRQVCVDCGDLSIRARLPDSNDLAALVPCRDMESATEALLVRCIEPAYRGDERVDLDDLPEEVLSQLAEKMSAADPLSDIALTMTCPACKQIWEENLDILSFFWAELTDRVHGLLHQIHTLAMAYGWRESDILALNPQRRQYYINLVNA